MKTITCFFTGITAAALTQAQPTITNAEDYTIGTVIQLRNCDPSGVWPGSGGAAQTWDFSSLTVMPDTVTVQMLSPASTAYGSSFPAANLVEKWSDGRYVYTIQTAVNSSLTGFVDTVSPITIHYPNPMVFALRPLTYGTVVTDTFTDNFTSGSYYFSGGGTCTIDADGYGTLLLPTGTYNNVLRVKVTQVQTDTIYPFMTTSTTTSVTHQWFDGVQVAPLLKIDSVHSTAFSSKTVRYLLPATPSGTQAFDRETNPLAVYPNPAHTSVTIKTGQPLSNAGIYVTDTKGRTVKEINAFYGDTFILPLDGWPQGMYILHLVQEGYTTGRCRLVITH